MGILGDMGYLRDLEYLEHYNILSGKGNLVFKQNFGPKSHWHEAKLARGPNSKILETLIPELK